MALNVEQKKDANTTKENAKKTVIASAMAFIKAFHKTVEEAPNSHVDQEIKNSISYDCHLTEEGLKAIATNDDLSLFIFAGLITQNSRLANERTRR